MNCQYNWIFLEFKVNVANNCDYESQHKQHEAGHVIGDLSSRLFYDRGLQIT